PGSAGLYVAAVIAAFELLSRLFLNMPPSMAIRKISRGIINMLFYSGLKATPVIWSRRHWPLVVMLAIFGIGSPQDSFAQYQVTDSMRWDREWSSGAVGVSQADVLEAMCRDCPLDIAMKQILPTDFNFFIADEVNKKARV